MEEIRIKAHWRVENDEWVKDGRKLTSVERLARIREAMESRGSILVEHWHLRGGRAPTRLVLDEFDDFIEYIRIEAAGGDAIEIWLVHELCTEKNRFEWGKVPDMDGRTPRRGAY